MRGFYFLLAVFFVIAGCASTVKTNLSSYTGPEPISKNQTIALVPADAKKADSLEYQHFRDMVKEKLQAGGYKVVGPAQHPDLVAEFDYAVMPARQQTTYYNSRPVFGPFGGFGYGYGSRWGYRRYSYLGYSFPFGSDDYEETRRYTKTYYDRNVSLTVHKPNDPKQIYEAKLNGSSACAKLDPVLSAMIDQLVADFPNKKQESKTITLPDEAC